MPFKPVSSGQITSFHSIPTREAIANDKQALLKALKRDSNYQSFIENFWLSDGENPQFLRYNDSNTPAIKIFLDFPQEVYGIQFQAGENTIDHNQLAQIFGPSSKAYEFICKLCQFGHFGSHSRPTVEEEHPTFPTGPLNPAAIQIPAYRFRAEDQTQFLNALERTNTHHEKTISDIMARHSAETLAFIACIQAMHAQPAHTLSLPAQFAQESDSRLIRPINAIEEQIGQLQHSIDALTRQLASSSPRPQPQPVQPPAPDAFSPAALNVIRDLYERIIQQERENAKLQIQLLNAQHQLELAAARHGNSGNSASPRSLGARTILQSPQGSNNGADHELNPSPSMRIQETFQGENENKEPNSPVSLINESPRSESLPQGSNIQNSGNEDESPASSQENIVRLRDAFLNSQGEYLVAQSENRTLKNRIVNLTEMISAQDVKIKELENSQDKLKEIINDKDSQISGLYSELNELQLQINRLLAELEMKMELLSQNQNRLLENDRGNSENELLEQANDHLRSEVDSLKSELETYKSMLAAQAKALEDLLNERNRNAAFLPLNTDNLNEIIRNQDSQISRLFPRLDELQSQIRHLQDELKIKENLLSQNQNRLLENDRENSENELLEQANSHLRYEVDSLKSELETYKSMLAAQAKALEDLLNERNRNVPSLPLNMVNLNENPQSYSFELPSPTDSEKSIYFDSIALPEAPTTKTPTHHSNSNSPKHTPRSNSAELSMISEETSLSENVEEQANPITSPLESGLNPASPSPNSPNGSQKASTIHGAYSYSYYMAPDWLAITPSPISQPQSSHGSNSPILNRSPQQSTPQNNEENISIVQSHSRTASPEMSMYSQFEQLLEDRRGQQTRLAELKGVLANLRNSTAASIARALKKRSALNQLLPINLKNVEQIIQQKETDLVNQIENQQQRYIKQELPKANRDLPGYVQLDFNDLQKANQAIEEIAVDIANAQAMANLHEQIEAEIGKRRDAQRLPMKYDTIQAAQKQRLEDLEDLLNGRPLQHKNGPGVSRLAKLEPPQKISTPENMPDLSKLGVRAQYGNLVAQRNPLLEAYNNLKKEQEKETRLLSEINTLTKPKDRDLRSRPAKIRLEIDVAECLRHLPSGQYIEGQSYNIAALQKLFRQAFKLTLAVKHEMEEAKRHNLGLETRLNDLLRAKRDKENERLRALAKKPQPEPIQQTVQVHSNPNKTTTLKKQNSSTNPTIAIRQQLNKAKQQLEAVQKVVEHSAAASSVARKTISLPLPKILAKKKMSSNEYPFETSHILYGLHRNMGAAEERIILPKEYAGSGFVEPNKELSFPVKIAEIHQKRFIKETDRELFEILQNIEKQDQESSPNWPKTPGNFSPLARITPPQKGGDNATEEVSLSPFFKRKAQQEALIANNHSPIR